MGGRRAGNLGRVGPYTLYERLGRGGMGEVYLARDRRGRPAAVKLLRSQIEDDPAARMRLDREVRALRRVESPYVARVIDADLSGDRPYLVMDYIQGDTLLDTVRRGGPLSGAGLLELAHGLAAALATIHAAGVVHRDLKPANVLIGAEGPVLIDFGIAHVMDATRVTDTGAFLGTPGYAAPEVFAGEPVGEPADLHAWGATVAFAATGRPTFGRGTAEAQMYAILNGQADLAGVPAALLPHIRAALHREPAKRPTAALLAGRLARLVRAAAAERTSRRRRPSSRDSWARRGEGRSPDASRNADGISPADGSHDSDGAPRNPDVRNPVDARHPDAGRLAGARNPDGGRTPGGRDQGVRDPGARDSDGGRSSGARSPDGGRDPGPRDSDVERSPGVRASDVGRVPGGRDSDGGRISGVRASDVGRVPGGRDSDGGRISGVRASDVGRASGGRDSDGGRISGARNPEAGRVPGGRDSDIGRSPARDGDAARDHGVRDSDGVRAAARVRPRRRRAVAAGQPGDPAAEPRPGEGSSGVGAGVILVALAVTAVPSVVVSVVWAPATFLITAGLAVLARALWGGHWLLRGRRPGRARGVLRVLTFPLALAGALVTAVVWPGLPAVGSAALSLWLASGMREPQEWWNLPGPIALAGVVFGIVCGGLVGREVERAGMRMPELRKEGLRALAVLGGFVAVCAAAVRAVAVFF
ncbi:protein kinase [Thermopolyspora sp. NPDC052614]|uniref:serine/threonine protein kinase n=1 Tax=Thermopolyspora sp. NPDC052614 TaxID=3155682 RepID=UPI003447A900